MVISSPLYKAVRNCYFYIEFAYDYKIKDSLPINFFFTFEEIIIFIVTINQYYLLLKVFFIF